MISYHERQYRFLILGCFLTMFVLPAESAEPGAAEQACVVAGGQTIASQRSGAGSYTVCLFEDNRQCEVAALAAGDCPSGGLKVTGYVTEAAVFCVITGGSYTVSVEDTGRELEPGICRLVSGKVCNVHEYFAGQC